MMLGCRRRKRCWYGYGLVLALGAMFFVRPALAFDIHAMTTSGGLPVWLVEDHTTPVVSIAFAFRGGYTADPEGKAGLAAMTSYLLDEGAGSLTSDIFQRRLADLAVDLEFEARSDEFFGSMRVLSDRTDAAFNLLRLALTDPRFDSEAVKRIRGQMLAAVGEDNQDPDEIAAKAWWRMNFPGHAYARSPRGTQQSIKELSPADLRQFVKSHFTRGNLVIGVVGDITPKELGVLLDASLGTLPAKADAPAVSPTAPAALGETALIRRDQPQSVVFFGHAAMDRTDPDFYAAYLINHILGGGGFGSRLTNKIREERGLTYGVNSWIINLDHADLIQGSMATDNATVPDALALLREEWRRMADDGPSIDELNDAKTYIIGSYPLRFTSSRSMAAGLVDIQLTGLPADYVTRRAEYFNAVTLDDAKRVAKRLLDPAKLSIVVVGNPDNLPTTRAAPPVD